LRLAQDALDAVIESAERKRAALLAARPEATRNEKVLLALPAAAKQIRDQLKRGLSGNPTEAGRARVASRSVLGEEIVLKPNKDRTHLVAHFQFNRMALSLYLETRIEKARRPLWRID